jgi:hypothetical protein
MGSIGNAKILLFLQLELQREKDEASDVLSEKFGLVGSTLRLILSISELGQEQKKALGALGVFPSLLGTVIYP